MDRHAVARTRSLLAIVPLAAFLASFAAPVRVAGDEPAVKPFTVIDRAVERWRRRPRPRELSYVVDYTGYTKTREFRRRFRVDHTVHDQETRVTMLTAEGPAPPFVQPEKQRLLATETFGFVPVATAATEQPSAAAAPPVPAGTPVIASVHATIRYPYDVNLVSVDNVADRSAYHLQFDPRQSRDDYPLREMWVDTSTYDVLQIVAQRFEHIGPIAVPYHVTPNKDRIG